MRKKWELRFPLVACIMVHPNCETAYGIALFISIAPMKYIVFIKHLEPWEMYRAYHVIKNNDRRTVAWFDGTAVVKSSKYDIWLYHVCFCCWPLRSTSASLSLLWRHNGRDGVSNHQPHDCLFNLSFRHRSKKTSKTHVTGFCAGNSPVTGEFPAQITSDAHYFIM